MHIHTDPQKVIASAVISELQSSDIYLSLKARLFDLRANLNGVRVTEAFLDEIVENEAKYICQPLYADIRGLIANRTVGHMYNARTGEFHSTQIGAFYKFEKEIDGDNAYLVGYARVPKRNKALCKALSDLFTDNALKFSFEVNCGVYTKEDDGTMTIDADERNYWEGECVVTFPACEAAVAQQLVAECLGKGDENMADEIIVNAETEVIEQTVETVAEEVQAEETIASETEVAEVVENTEAAETTEVAEVETAETVYVTQNHTEIDNFRAYNSDTGEEVEQRVVVETTTHTPVRLAEEENQEEDNEDVVVEAACNTDDEEDEDNHETAANDEDERTECAEQNSDVYVLIAELRTSIEEMRSEIAELRAANAALEQASTEVVAEVEETESSEVIAETVVSVNEYNQTLVSPFMAEIAAPKKYTLLDRETKTTIKYA